ncbi:amino acid adenylation domain-containing protein [Chitinophaga oryzae]|uniref:Amino acid adenylation domain-containing protein n=1 Tax=Chitinophaga oryzae TaxID=2725414 RepID=A0ABX6LE02_9BACT|nr:non-ribosomal peptide synthetase [Chitinophaga oryzae]QJB38355.1 amino acid adenylation domain-containing protein [Chitinophaga oryzae]
MKNVDPLQFTDPKYVSFFQYWRAAEDAPTNFTFRLQFTRQPLVKTSTRVFRLPGSAAIPLLRLVPGEKSALFTAFIAAVAWLLDRYCGQKDIILHTPLLQTSRPAIVYEPFVPIRIRIDPSADLQTHLEHCRTAVKTAYRHQNFPLSLVSRRQQDYLSSNILLCMEGLHQPQQATQHDLIYHIENTGQDIVLRVTWQEAYFPSWFIDNMLSHLMNTFGGLENITTRLSDVRILGEHERQQLRRFSSSRNDTLPAATIHGFFEEKAEQFPDHVALVHHAAMYTYRALNEKVNQLSHRLRMVHNITQGSMIGICMQRSAWQVIAMLAILKAGAVYVPFDIHLPDARAQFMLADANIRLMITDATTQARFDPAVPTIGIEQNILPASGNFPVSNPSPVATPQDLAYVIYTSGTTGQPKGVPIKHAGVVNMATDQVLRFGIRNTDRVAAFANVTFDAAVSEVLMALYAGAGIVVTDEALIKDTTRLLDEWRLQRVSVVTLPPAYLRILPPDALRFLRVLITAGEPANPETARYCSGFLEYYNAYGPTENTVCTSIYKATPDGPCPRRLPVGTPIANTQVYILDERYQPTPVGITGRLYIAGMGLSPGYLNRPDLNREKFIRLPEHTDTLLYDSGDLARWLPDGNLDFTGRADDLIKVDGIRIEPEEISNLLLQHPQVKLCEVLAVGTTAEKRLVAFVQPTPGTPAVTEQMFADFLYERLPAYMCPSRIILTSHIPVNSNGKTDKQALTALLDHQTSYAAPVNEAEAHMQGIWQQALNLPRISRDGHFFQLGATSINVISLHTLLKQEHPGFDIRMIFRFPVLSEFTAAFLEDKKRYT